MPESIPAAADTLWNTRYTDAALAQLRAQGYPVLDADAARLSPLGDAHLNVHGRYAFTPPTGKGLRPLRDPTRPGRPGLNCGEPRSLAVARPVKVHPDPVAGTYPARRPATGLASLSSGTPSGTITR
jgi:hypothetical protein